MPFYARFAIGLSTLALSIAVASCGPVMEATRPDPVDIKQFVPGEARINVLAEVGAPVATTKESGNSCDIYKLYTRGPGAVGKGVIAAGEAVGDVFTLGLSEVLWTPGEAMTRNSKHTVLFCYDPASKLVSVNESETHVDN
jgi:hypothetical protein